MRKNGIKLILVYGVIKNIKDLRDKVQRATNNPEELVNLLCKDFNVRQSEQDTWLTFREIDNEATFDMNEIYDTYRCTDGVDLSSTLDLTCATILVMKGDKKFCVQQYFIPSANLEFKIKDDKIPYDKWEKRGLVTICEGSKVDYSKVTEWFIRMKNDYEISTMWIGYDPWNSNYWINEMKNNFGEEVMHEVRQGAKTMSNPMKILGADLIDKKLNYNNNPILKWCLCNTNVKRDENDNIRPIKRTKTKSENRWHSKFNYSLCSVI